MHNFKSGMRTFVFRIFRILPVDKKLLYINEDLIFYENSRIALVKSYRGDFLRKYIKAIFISIKRIIEILGMSIIRFLTEIIMNLFEILIVLCEMIVELFSELLELNFKIFAFLPVLFIKQKSESLVVEVEFKEPNKVEEI